MRGVGPPYRRGESIDETPENRAKKMHQLMPFSFLAEGRRRQAIGSGEKEMRRSGDEGMRREGGKQSVRQ